ncbi:MAG: DUF2007 domain-containing protein [Pirellulales bacterium]|nr:DUF2007 domain-containing protein [Pirellulales bacterium]
MSLEFAMGEYDFRDNLVPLLRFGTPSEATIAQQYLNAQGIETFLDETNTATTLSHIGASLRGPRLSVRQGDLRRAREVLDKVLRNYAPDAETGAKMGEATYGETPATYEDAEDDANDYYASDWSGETWDTGYDDLEDDEYDEDDEPYSELSPPTPPMTRAFRAAVIGAIFLPLLVLNVYSIELVIRHRLWERQQGEAGTNWRFPVAMIFNAIGITFFWIIFQSF